jgi:hypothetical protein
MRLRPATRDIVVLLLIVLGVIHFLVQFEFVSWPSSLSESVHKLSQKVKLAHNRPKYAEYEGENGRENQTFSTRVRWKTGEAPKTATLAHAPGMSRCSVLVTGPP